MSAFSAFFALKGAIESTLERSVAEEVPGRPITWGNGDATAYSFAEFNEKFAAAGLGDTAGNPYLKNEGYWSCTEYNAEYAWVYYNTGYVYKKEKCDSEGEGTGYVRAVLAF